MTALSKLHTDSKATTYQSLSVGQQSFLEKKLGAAERVPSAKGDQPEQKKLGAAEHVPSAMGDLFEAGHWRGHLSHPPGPTCCIQPLSEAARVPLCSKQDHHKTLPVKLQLHTSEPHYHATE